MAQHTRHPMLTHLDQLVGEWETEATHQLLPDTIVRGRSTFAWLEGGFFLVERSRNDHPDFPDGLNVFGCDDPDGADDPGEAGGGCSIRYFDSRGVFRRYALEAEAGVFRFWRDSPGFSQRFTGTLGHAGDTIAGVAELSRDGTVWEEDLWITYRRVR